MSDSLIHRWSKQKSQADVQDSVPAQAKEQEPSPSLDNHEVEPKELAENDNAVEDNEEEKEPVELPPIESLSEDSDYSPFMSSEVEEGIRKLALRKLFKSPFFNVVDGLNDYDDDFTSFEALGDIITSDMKFHEERKKAEQALKEQHMDEAQVPSEPDQVESLAKDDEQDTSDPDLTDEKNDLDQQASRIDDEGCSDDEEHNDESDDLPLEPQV